MGINKKHRILFHELSRYPNRNHSYQELSELLEVSTRSVRNYCQALEDYILEMGITDSIERTTAGISYVGTPKQTKQILSRIGGSGFYEYHLSPDDRILAIILILLSSTSPVTVSELCDTLFVSRATLLNDIEKVKLYFHQFHIRFDQSTNRGYSLKIEESQRQDIICTTCFPYLKDWNILGSETGTSHFLFEHILYLSDILSDICRIVQKVELQYGVTITDAIYKQTVLVLSILCKRLIQKQQIENSLQLDPKLYHVSVGSIARSMLSELKETFHVSYCDKDMLYLAWHLHLCHFDLLQNFEHSVDLYFYMEVQQFLHELEKNLPCSFLNEQHFSIMLIRHLWSIRNISPEIDNTMAEKIIEYYPECYNAVKQHIGIIERCIGRPCTETEINSILIYVVAEIERQTPQTTKPKVIVLCHIGIGTANFLADRLVETFNLEISEVTTIHKLSEVLRKDNFDLLISTVPLKLENVNCITVSPNLEDSDIISIQKALATVQRAKRLSLGEYNMFQNATSDFNSILKPDHFILDIPCSDWREALDIAARPLLNAREILPQYIDAIKYSVERNGPYFVFSPGIALAHAAPTDGVLQLCCSFYRPQKPVIFNHKTNDPVSLIIIIGLTDANTQIHFVSALMNTFRKETIRNHILLAASPEELITILLENC